MTVYVFVDLARLVTHGINIHFHKKLFLIINFIVLVHEEYWYKKKKSPVNFSLVCDT